MTTDRATGTIFVDVDGTLLLWPTVAGAPRPGEVPTVNQPLVDAIKRWLYADTARRLVIWTMGGTEHAVMAATICGLPMAICLAKPEFIIDDADAKLFHKKHFATHPDAFMVACRG